MSFDWSPGGCCCGDNPFELCVVSTPGTPIQWAILRLVKKYTQTDTDSRNLLTWDEEWGDETREDTILAMTVEDTLYVVQEDLATTPDTIHVASYDVNDGTLNWEQTWTENGVALSFALNGLPVGSGFDSFACNSTTLYQNQSRRVITTSGVAGPYSGIINELDYDPRDGELSAVWMPKRLASHDYPKVACIRAFFENFSGEVTVTDIGGGDYTHEYNLTVDSVCQLGIGTWNPDGGSASSVTEIDEKRVTWTCYQSETWGFPTPVRDPNDIDVFIDSNTDAFPNGTNVRGSVTGFSNIGSKFIAAWQTAHGINNVFSGGLFPWVRASGDYSVGEYLNVESTEIWERDLGATTVLHSQLATVHDDPPDASYADHLHIDANDVLRGYNSAGTQLWSEDLSGGEPFILSVNDTWAFVHYHLDYTTDLAPDGRDWSNVSYPIMGEPQEIRYWMVKLDNSEWEPCRIEETVADEWTHHDNATLPYGTGYSAFAQFNLDLIKSTSHEYGPPETTYDTTPP